MSLLLSYGLANAVCAMPLALLAFLAGKYTRRPALAHSLWLLVLVKLITPPLFRFDFAWLPPEPAPTSRTVDPKIAPPHLAGKKSYVLIAANNANPNDPRDGASPPAYYWAYLAQPESTTATPAVAPRFDWSPWLRAAQGVWLSGAAIFFLAALGRIVRFQILLRHAWRASAALQVEVAALGAQMGLRRAPEVWLIPGCLPPFVWALGRARIFFPVGLLDRLDDAERGSLLTHELAHVYRRDHWVRWLELIVQALYWWFPLVWWGRRQLQSCEEECCDAWVTGVVPSRAYATAIISTMDFLAEKPTEVPALASGLSQMPALRQRLTLIMEGATPKRLTRAGQFVVFAVAASLLPMLPMLTAAEAPPAVQPEPVVGRLNFAPVKAAAFYQPVAVEGKRTFIELARAGQVARTRGPSEPQVAFAVRFARDLSTQIKTEPVRYWRFREEAEPTYDLLAYPEYWTYQPANVNAYWIHDTQTLEPTVLRYLNASYQPAIVVHTTKAGSEKNRQPMAGFFEKKEGKEGK
jgi:beta-lactamase regulating signal transducer with metallopeptidase domain